MGIFGKIANGVRNAVTHPKDTAETAWHAAVTAARENPVVQTSTTVVNKVTEVRERLDEKALSVENWILDHTFRPVSAVNTAGDWVSSQIDKIDTEIPVLDPASDVTRATLGFVSDMVFGTVSLAAMGTPLGALETSVNIHELDNNGELWDTIKAMPGALVEPITTPWEEGEKTEAVTRGVLEVASLFVGGAGLLKLGRLGRAGRVADAVPDVDAPHPRPPKPEAPKPGADTPQPLARTSDTPGSITREPGAKVSEREMSAGQAFADYGYNVTLRATIDVDGHRSPDLFVDGIGLVDEYSPRPESGLTSIARAIEKKNTQAPAVIVQADLTEAQMAEVAARVWGKDNAQNIKTIFFKSPTDGTIVRFDRP